MTREHKSFRFEVKAVDDEQGLIEAYGSVFGNIDQGDDVVDQGSFKRTIKNSKARVSAGKSDFLAMMLWNHDTEHFLPIGGWYDLEEDSHGLLGKGKIIVDTQLGRDVYTLIKNKVINEFSIGYEVMQGGAYYDKNTGARHLTELRLWEVSPVVWAMNNEALLVGVKNMDSEHTEYKSVCGSTSGPIGPRDESWDGSEAKAWIWEQALDAEGNVKPDVAKRYFMRVDGDPALKGSYGYPFWIHGHISVGGIKAVAGALSGARNAEADADDAGMKKRVERLYSRVNKKYPDADPLVPPWQDGKSGAGGWDRKDLSDHFQEQMGQDLCEDWQDVYLCSLTGAVFDAFKEGSGDPTTSVAQALDDFKALVLSKFVTQAIEYDLSGYLEDNGFSADYLAQYGNDSRPNHGYMSRRKPIVRKDMLSGDATTGGFYASDGSPALVTTAHVDKLHQAATKAMKAVTDHVAQVHNAAAEITTLLGGSNELTPTEKRVLPSAKAGRAFSVANAQALSDHADTLNDLADGHQKVMTRQIKTITTVADDLASILQGAEAAYGTDPGTPTEGRQEGKHRGTSSQEGTRATSSRSSNAQDTVNEDEIATSLQMLQALRTTA